VKKKKKKPVTVHALRRRHAKAVRNLKADLVRVKWQLARAKDELRQIHEEDVRNLDAYDKCAAAVTANERALFEASPAYKRYQEWRRTGQFVRKGDWRAP